MAQENYNNIITTRMSMITWVLRDELIAYKHMYVPRGPYTRKVLYLEDYFTGYSTLLKDISENCHANVHTSLNSGLNNPQVVIDSWLLLNLQPLPSEKVPPKPDFTLSQAKLYSMNALEWLHLTGAPGVDAVVPNRGTRSGCAHLTESGYGST